MTDGLCSIVAGYCSICPPAAVVTGGELVDRHPGRAVEVSNVPSHSEMSAAISSFSTCLDLLILFDLKPEHTVMERTPGMCFPAPFISAHVSAPQRRGALKVTASCFSDPISFFFFDGSYLVISKA